MVRPSSGWRGPDPEAPTQYPTLGHVVARWIEANCVIPDGPFVGEPFVLTREQYQFLCQHYRLRPDAEVDVMRPSAPFVYRHSMLVRPQKWGKGPLSAAWICAEAAGPVLFDGWDEDGEPTGRSWDTPWIQIAAASEDQTANVWRALLPMIQLGPLRHVIPDTGLTRINLPGGGFIEPVTAEGRSRLGQRITAALHDEPHSWTKANGGWRLADTQRRNLAGMGGRSIATTNAWDPAENSDAQRTFEAHLPDVWIDYPFPPRGSVGNKRERWRVLQYVYADPWWVDLNRIDADVEELVAKGDPQQAERFFLNRLVYSAGTWLPEGLWASREADVDVPPGAAIVLGFDGSESDDWTAIRASTIDGHRFTPTYGPDRLPTIWDPQRYGGSIPRGEVMAAFDEICSTYHVVLAYCDPRDWQSEIGDLALRWGSKVFIEWATYRTVQMHEALDRAVTDLVSGRTTHDACPITATHVANARKLARPGQRYILGKPVQHQKIDAAMADVLASEAAATARENGMRPVRRGIIVY